MSDFGPSVAGKAARVEGTLPARPPVRPRYLRTHSPVAGPGEAHFIPSAAPAVQINAANVSPSPQLTVLSPVTRRKAGA